MFSFCSTTLVTKLNNFLLKPEAWFRPPSQLLIFTADLTPLNLPTLRLGTAKSDSNWEFIWPRGHKGKLCLWALLALLPQFCQPARNPHDGSTCLYCSSWELQKFKTRSPTPETSSAEEIAPNQDLNSQFPQKHGEGRRMKKWGAGVKRAPQRRLGLSRASGDNGSMPHRPHTSVASSLLAACRACTGWDVPASSLQAPRNSVATVTSSFLTDWFRVW